MADEQRQIYDLLMERYHELEDISPEVHLVCPKINDDDDTNYAEPDELDANGSTPKLKKERIEDARKRRETVYNLSLILAINTDEASTWLPYWTDRVGGCLTKCDYCVRLWHRTRDEFISSLRDRFQDVIIDCIAQKLIEFDTNRIKAGLEKAKSILVQQGAMHITKLANHDIAAVIALFDALCSMAYLSVPEHRDTFNYVFENTQKRKPLKMQGGIIPVMTWFLFDDDYFRNRFARAAWDSVPAGSLDEGTWDWAVSRNLTQMVRGASLAYTGQVSSPQSIIRFWRGFSIILSKMSERLILDKLRSLEPNVYFVSLEHLATPSEEALALVLGGLRILMETSAKAFWEAFDQVTPNQLADQVLRSPAFRPFLDRSFQPEMLVQDGNVLTPVLAVWVRALFRSLPSARRSDVCEVLLYHLFDTFKNDPSSSPAAQSICILAGLSALSESLDGYLQPSAKFDPGTALIVVNQLLNRVVQYKDVIVAAAELPLSHTYNVGTSNAAMSVVHSSLALDAKATWVEWTAINDEIPVQSAVIRNSGALWSGFLAMLWPGQIPLAKAMLMATMPLRAIEQFIPPRKGQLTKEKEAFNQRYRQQAEAIGRILNRLTDFTPPELHLLCFDIQIHTLHPIVASLIHGEAVIREAGSELLKAITTEVQLSEAYNKMLEEYFGPFLNAFAESVTKITDRDSNSPWAPMSPILECSELVLNGLCDPSVGQLRSRNLFPGDLVVVERWWKTSWQCIDHSFINIKGWHERVEKKVMEDFCRDAMELADKFLAQDGLMVSAFSRQGEGVADGETDAEAMKRVLEPPRQNMFGMVQMLQLRDKYLIQGIVNVLLKLLNRLVSNKLELPRNTSASIQNMCKKRKMPDGKFDYVTRTNLTDGQRIEILKALGEDAEIDVQYLGTKPAAAKEAREKEKAMKQSKLDFSKGTPASGTRLEADQSTKTAEKKSFLLDAFKAEGLARAKEVQKAQKALISQQSTSSFKEKRLREQEEMKRKKEEAIARAQALRAPPKTVPGEGSGLQGIAGVRGKDHAPAQKDELFGSSSEDEDDEDDEDDDELLQRSKAGKDNLAAEERRRQLALLEKQRGPVKKTKLVRSAKDMRARLIPPMDILHQAILEWDIFHEGNDPPNGYSCLEVSDAYSNPLEYKQTFFPLLINEAWRSFVTAKDEAIETTKPFSLKVTNRMTIDKFLEVTAMVPLGVNRERVVSEGDIVIFSTSNDPLNQPHELHCLARTWRTKMKNNMLEIVFRVNSRNNQFASVTISGAEVWGVKITNMTTIEREYAALESFQYYDLMDEVLKADISPMLNFGEEAIAGVMQNYQLNLGQAKAILNAKENDGFTLIQGPPGTGKTKTIIAMAGSLLSGVLKPGADKAVSISRPVAAGPNGPNGTPAKKLLVCAPSNAAVDELVLRLKQGVKTMNGAHHKIEVLRLGRSDAINAAVRDVTLDELVKAKMDKVVENMSNSMSDREKLHKEAGDIKKKVQEVTLMLDTARSVGDRTEINRLQMEYDELKRRQSNIGRRIDADKSTGNTYAREMEIKRAQIQQEILDKAQVLCATLSGSGHEMFKNLNVEFETVIIDEAAQCVELSALIPLKYGCSKCILVGDPKQLPPTVLSQSAARFGYDQSLFVRMQKRHAKHVHLLNKQYRMHPEISLFPSKEFYEGLLQDGGDMAKLRWQPWHQSALLGPYRFFDVRGSQERGPRNASLVNEEELRVAMQLYQRFRSDYSNINLKGKIGIITPYKAQLMRLRQRFADRFGKDIAENIEFNTTDAFQGRECEIIIFSCVRASPTGGIGFMTDIRRMNVGLTRARSSLWILGDSRALVQGEFWAKLIDDARKRDRYTSGNIMNILSKPGQKLPVPDWVGSLKQESPDSDFEMKDAEPVAAYPVPTKAIEAPKVISPTIADPVPRKPSYPGSGFGGFNARGEATSTKQRGSSSPVTPVSASDFGVKKRPLSPDGVNNGPNAKKLHNSLANAPKGPRAMQDPRPTKLEKPSVPTDPSAMEVLGLVPPTRPPRPPQMPQMPQMSNPLPTGQQPARERIIKQNPNGPRLNIGQTKKKKTDPFIKRKPGK